MNMPLIVPTLGLDLSLLTRLAKSIDYPIAEKLVINNGEPGALREWHNLNPGWEGCQSWENIGVAASWNFATEIFHSETAWLIVNDDQEFQPGCLKRVYEAAEAHAKDYPFIFVNEFRAFDFFVWTRKGVDELGLFDENFWPAYFEDWEMRLRMDIAGLQGYAIPGPFPVKHGKPQPGGPAYHKMLKACEELNQNYFMRKWGVVDDKNPKWTTPFNDPHKSLKYWKVEPERRKLLEAEWNEFWDRPNRSVYT
jgi:hypothetical protein